MEAQSKRKEYVFDGCGINGPDEYRTRLATLTIDGHKLGIGPALAAVPEMLAFIKSLANDKYDRVSPHVKYEAQQILESINQ